MPKIAVIVFPGSNCEVETARAVRRNGMEAEVVRWNEPEKIADFDGAVIVGGFSFEDRSRSGVIAAAEPMMTEVKRAASLGKPILGICNGAQILVESGLVPGYADSPQITLTWNERKTGDSIATGFFSSWCTISADGSAKQGAFNNWNRQMSIPIAHGEGRFLGSDAIFDRIESQGQAVFRYTDENGHAKPEFPTNPNGSMRNLAGISNAEGNVVAMMPHPERTDGGDAIFASMCQWIKEGKGKPFSLPTERVLVPAPQPMPRAAIEIFVELLITDNAEATVNGALQKSLPNAKLRRTEFFGIDGISGDPIAIATAVIESGEILNPNKERATIRIGERIFAFAKGTGVVSTNKFSPKLVVVEHSDPRGASLSATFRKALSETGISILHGVAWQVISGEIDAIGQTQLIGNLNGSTTFLTE